MRQGLLDSALYANIDNKLDKMLDQFKITIIVKEGYDTGRSTILLHTTDR